MWKLGEYLTFNIATYDKTIYIMKTRLCMLKVENQNITHYNYGRLLNSYE